MVLGNNKPNDPNRFEHREADKTIEINVGHFFFVRKGYDIAERDIDNLDFNH